MPISTFPEFRKRDKDPGVEEVTWPSIILYQFAEIPGCESASPFCVKVRRILNYKRLRYSVENIRRPPTKKQSPTGKIPVLSYNGDLIPDSTDIARFIENRHLVPALFPGDPELEARSHILEDWADESLYWYVVYFRWAVEENRERVVRAVFSWMPTPLRMVVAMIVRRTIFRML